MSLGFRSVLFSPLTPDGSGVESVARGIQYRWRAVHPWDAGDDAGGMETQWSPPLLIDGAALTRDLPVTPSGNGLDVEITILFDGDSRVPKSRIETVIVPAGAGTIDFYNTVAADGEILVRVNRTTLSPLTELSSADHAALVALQGVVAAISGGASTVEAITNMSPLAKLLNKDTTQGAMQTRLNVPPVGAPPTAHTHVATTDLTATGTKSNATYLRGDNTWSTPPGTPGALDHYSDISSLPGYPSTFPPSAHITRVADIDGSATVEAFLLAANQAAALTAIGAVSTSHGHGIADLPAGVGLFASGASTPRPTARTDLTVTWLADSAPSNAILGDIWLNGPN